MDADHLDAAIPVEEDAVITYPQSIAVRMVNQRLDVDCIGHSLKSGHSIADLLLMVRM
ncbi:hypothetical protein C4K01_4466 [Pseudomonas synxantha]|nr:hypothetical protein C4K01_4466 [Pseudomonas synxantha]